MAEHDVELRGERRIGQAPPALQPVDHLARGTTAGHRRRARSSRRRRPIARSARRRPRALVMSPLTMTGIVTASLTSRMNSQSARAGIELAARAAVHGDHADAAGFGDSREPRRVAAVLVPAGAHLQVTGRSTALTVASRMRAACTSSRISAEPAWPLTTFFTGQPKLMSMMRGAAIGVELRRLGHHLRARSRRAAPPSAAPPAQLCAIVSDLPCLADHRLAGDHLGDDQPRPVPLDQAAKRQIGHARHRRQDHRIVEREGADENAHDLRKYCRLPND